MKFLCSEFSSTFHLKVKPKYSPQPVGLYRSWLYSFPQILFLQLLLPHHLLPIDPIIDHRHIFDHPCIKYIKWQMP
jgi:hypothetical protein